MTERDSSRGRPIIPASAGDTHSDHAAHAAPAVHPRYCGEPASSSAVGMGIRGSSPRARGSPARGAGRLQSAGFIPARAGKPLLGVGTGARHRVHPRSRGGDQATPTLAGSRAGPSPRLRGQARGRCVWIIAHGSSPPERGSLVDDAVPPNDPGFIPAAAGIRSREQPLVVGHPRFIPAHAGPFRTAVDEEMAGSIPRSCGGSLAHACRLRHPTVDPRCRAVVARAGVALPVVLSLPRVHQRSAGCLKVARVACGDLHSVGDRDARDLGVRQLEPLSVLFGLGCGISECQGCAFVE